MNKAEELQAAGQTGPERRARSRSTGRRTALLMHALSSLVVLLILVDMIWKPGA